MKKKNLDELQVQFDDIWAFKQSVTGELLEMQHKSSTCAKRLSKLNSIRAMLEGSHEPDEIVAGKLDALKTDLDEAESSYRELQLQVDRLQKVEVEAISQVQAAENALKVERLSRQS